ncbi:MAG: molybdopterin-dependent oxidoreductase [Gammaproteobacteria bacterium]|nr:molybdopterin-dependent oxidoreductase [Gammaproteobacteria bacterium]MCP5405948.1 molybdopterin-dependent oxidoreductase [Chromatiaceae bacterium]MCP5442505.1 molybdopterin-dependent oxidoreductase [Chromatiaceae bacterium]
MAWSFPRLSRRSFLKSSGATGAALAITPPLLLNGCASQQKAVGKEEVSYTICNFCSSLCNVRVTTRTTNGAKRIVKLDGNPNSTLNRGKMCARGQAGLRQTYDSDRIKTPLIRIEGSKRGEYAFRTASWEEAWDYIEKKSRKAAIQPWEWTMVGGWTSCVFYMNWSVPFALANEVPNIVASPMQHCVTTGHLGTDTVTGNFNIHDEILPDYDNAKYILLIGNNASIGAVSTSRMVRFAQGKKNGAKVVAVDPRLSETAAKADEWISIRPGTDLDLCLAMLQVMLDEHLYDATFLKRHSNMPFLVYKDAAGAWQMAKDSQGRPLVKDDGGKQKLEEALAAGEHRLPQVLDITDAPIRILPAYTNDNRQDINGYAFCPALEVPPGTRSEHTGEHELLTVFQAQREEIKANTPEWAEKTTGIPADTIRRIAREFGTTRPAIVDPGWHGARYASVMMLRRVQAMMQALNGGIDREGGWIMSGEFHHKVAKQWQARQSGVNMESQLANMAGLDFANLVIGALSKGENFSHGHPGFTWAYAQQQKEAGKPWVALPVMADEGLKESVEGKLNWKGKPYKTRAMFINAANPVRHYYPDTYWKEMMQHENMELVVLLDVLPSDTTPYADVILPNSTYLERNEPTLYGNGVNQDLAITTRYAAIDPLYDSWESPDVLLRMTEIVSGNVAGFLKYMEALTGLPAEPVKTTLAQKQKEGVRSPFSAACREVAFAVKAKELGVTPEHIDETLREKGIYHEEDWQELLKHTAIPEKIPAVTPSGRLEFYSGLFDSLRALGVEGPAFSVLASAVPVSCRKDAGMAEPLAPDEFYFTYGKTPTVSYGSTNSNNPVLNAINTFKSDIYRGVWIHPERAEKLGIKNGDRIGLTNTLSGQHQEGHAHVTRKVNRDALFLHSSFGVENPQLTRSFAYGGVATNKLIPHTVEPVVAGFRSQEFTIKVSKIDSAKGGAA